MSNKASLGACLLGLGLSSVLLVGPASCGGGDDRPGNIDNSGGTGGVGGDPDASGDGKTGGTGGKPDASTGGKDSGPDAKSDSEAGEASTDADLDGEAAVDGEAGPVVGAPVVEVTSPAAATDPSNDTIIVGDQIDVLCTAKQSTDTGALPVNPASVKIAVLDKNMAVVTELPGTATQNPDEYKATFVLTTIPNGPFSARCMAADTSTPAKTGSDVNTTFVDHGPDISVTTPAPASAYPLTGAVPFAFKVTPSLLATTDPEAAVASVTLNVNGVNIVPTPDTSVPNGYKNAVNFNDTTIFPQPPSGSVPVVIKAKNSRTPTAAERTQSYNFIVDGAGPIVTIKSHKNQEIIGGKVTLAFSVVDALSGVDSKTVLVELNQAQNFYAQNVQWTNTGNDYTFTFDSANVQGSKVQLTVNVTASDKAGNKSAGESLILYLDNQPPIVDLDPDNVRVLKYVGTTAVCSMSFDPVGVWPANDATPYPYVTPSFEYFRALVYDKTNSVDGQLVHYYANTDPASVYLYLQPDGPTVPLLVNNDSDPECDTLATIVGGKTLPNLHLNPIVPAGSPWYTTDSPATPPAIPPNPNPPPPDLCILGSEVQPQKLCTNNASDLSVIIKHGVSGSEPVIYGIGQMTGVECTGTGWELSSQVAQATQKEGWFCLAVAAKDKVGNASISPPLRICYDDPGTSFVPTCANSSTTPPTCTDGCTPPAGWPPTILVVK